MLTLTWRPSNDLTRLSNALSTTALHPRPLPIVLNSSKQSGIVGDTSTKFTDLSGPSKTHPRYFPTSVRLHKTSPDHPGRERSAVKSAKQRVLMHGHQGWNVRHGLCHIYMIYVYIWVVHSFCLFCCLFIIVTTQFVALYEPCKPKPKPKPSTYDTRTTTPWQRSKFRYLDRSQSNKYAINMQIQTISVSK